MKRCKNCRLWRTFKGDEPTIPRRSSRACMLRLATRTNPDGEKVLLPSLNPDDPKGPHWGKRTAANFVCDKFVAKHSPLVHSTNQSPTATSDNSPAE